ncbi:MAG: hypothetical protein KF873_19285 [Gemmataceae bacterium]|nr:hypothetical protein [Gemmataceae bacterium]
MNIALHNDFSYQHNPFQRIRQSIAGLVVSIEHEIGLPGSRETISNVGAGNCRRALMDYRHGIYDAKSSCRYLFAAYGGPLEELESFLSKVDLEGVSFNFETNEDRRNSLGIIGNMIKEIRPTFDKFAVWCEGWDFGEDRGTISRRPDYVVVVPKEHPNAGDNVTIFGVGRRVRKPTWKLLRKLADARETGKRLSLAELQAVAGQDAHGYITDFNKLGDGYPLIDMPGRRNKGRGYALN